MGGRSAREKIFPMMLWKLGGDVPVDLPNISSWTFWCAHHRGPFTSWKTNKTTITQLGTCAVEIEHENNKKRYNFL